MIEVEAVTESALPAIQITGLPGEVIRESRDRIRGCLSALGFGIPSARTVVHLSPANTRKQGSQLDLPIALSILAAEELLPKESLQRCAFLGELALDGRVKRIAGALALTETAVKQPHIHSVFIPKENEREVALLNSRKIFLISDIPEILGHLRGESMLQPQPEYTLRDEGRNGLSYPTLDDVWGHALAKRALQISLAGKHHMLMVGAPGVGKSMLASVAASLLPPLTTSEWIEVVRTHSYHSEQLPPMLAAPIRSPHHSVSGNAFLGGGSGVVIPGEVTLAHRGVLFMDELPEFHRDSIEGLRVPLEHGEIHLRRVDAALKLPAQFTLIGAMNPCPCGHFQMKGKRCVCSPETAGKYRRKVSGPILDRLDILVLLSKEIPPTGEATKVATSHARIKEELMHAVTLRRERESLKTAPPLLEECTPSTREMLSKLRHDPMWSYRALKKTLGVARTIADLEKSVRIECDHFEEARLFRCPDSCNF